MTIPRSTQLLRRIVGLTAAPALLLTVAAACGDDDESGGGDSSSFCEDARALDSSFGDIDPTDAEAFGDAITAFDELDPPAELEDDWNTFLDALRSFEDIDLTDPSSVDQSDFADAEAASERISTYMEEECGIASE